MAIGTAATPEGAPVNDDGVNDDPFAALDYIDDEAEAPTPALLADDPTDGDAEEAPEPGDDAETADEAEESEEPAEAAPALDMTAPVKVKVNGEEIEVPLEEALKGYSRLEDYKVKTAALAEQGRALHGELSERLQTALSTFAAADPILALANTVDMEALKATDREQWRTLTEEIADRQRVIAQVQDQIIEAKAREAEAVGQREYELLVKADPALSDADTYDRRIGDLRTYLSRNHGFSDADLNAINNHKYILIAEKAAAYDKLMAAKKELPAKVAPPPKPQAKTLKSSGNAAQAPRSSRPPPPNASQSAWQAWFDKNV